MDETVAARLRTCFKRHPGVRLAIVFGSVAADRARPDSDIDVAVSMGRPMTAEQRVDLMGDIAYATGRPVDLVDLPAAGCLVVREALENGIQIMVADPHERARVITRLLIDEADFLPLYRRIVAGQMERLRRGE